MKFYNKLAVTATYTIPLALLQRFGHNGIESLIYAALRECLNQQPNLGITIVDEGTKEPKWRRLTTIDLHEIVTVVSADPNANPDKWVQDAHRVLFPQVGKLPLWRVVIVFQDSALKGSPSHVSFAIGFFSHHAIADGLSGAAFHLTFLDALNTLISFSGDPPTNSNELPIFVVPKLPLAPTLEMKAKLSVSILFLFNQIFKAFIYNPVDRLNWSGPLVNAAHARPPPACIRSFSLTPMLVKKLVAKCRAEKTTITALLTVLTARELALMYPGYKRFSGSVPFSMRKFTGHSPKDMGVLVSNVTIPFSSEACPSQKYISCYSMPHGKPPSGDDKNLWDSARACKHHIDKSTASTRDQRVNLLRFLGDYNAYFLGLLGTKRAHAFEVTNIGVVDGGVGSDEGKARFDQISLSTGGCTFGEPYVIFVATAKDGLMTVSIGWQSVVVSDEEAKDLLEYLERESKRLVDL